MSGGGQTPYIGSKISLISKLDIRYEGVLYTVNTSDSTIALVKVRSFGTEDRPTANPVAAREDVYEHIIFKASDIKDLIVCETAKASAAPMGGLPYDPAIVSVSNRATNDQPAPSGTGSSRSTTSPTATGLANRQSPTSRVGSSGPGRGAVKGPTGPVSRYPNNYNDHRMRGNYQQQSGGYVRGNSQQTNRGGRGGYGGYVMPRTSNASNVAREKVRYESDYDFEKANEQFQESLSELLKDKLHIDQAEHKDENVVDIKDGDDKDDEKFYDKSSSFFDRISCEALEKAEGRKGRPDWRKERETNQETFGHSAVRSMNYRRGYGRGMRGTQGGGYGGYGGQRYNNGYNNFGGYNNRYNNGGGYQQGGYNNRGGGFRRHAGNSSTGQSQVQA